MHISLKKNLKKDKSAQIGLIIIIILFLFAAIAPFFTGDPEAFSNSILSEPGTRHYLGTNDLGQDIFSRLLYGLRTSMLTSVSVGIIATSISVFVGVCSGFIGGTFDMVVMRIIDAFLVLPPIIILILISAFILREKRKKKVEVR